MTTRSDERGIAMILALLMVLVVSILTTSMVFVARSEALSSMSYTAMSQVRYGAESGVHAAANYLMSASYTPPLPADLANYDLTVSPVQFGGAAVILSTEPGISNYPDANVIADFTANSQGILDVNAADVNYGARATLVSMRQITDTATGLPVTVQVWEITGRAMMVSAAGSLVEVTATVERQPVPLFSYAAFATHNGCNALSFAGGAETFSYDSSQLDVNGLPVVENTGGNVGTNGNLDGNGNTTTVNGSLSTPRSGVGNCTSNNVTAATVSGFATIEEGLVTLPQHVDLETPPDPNPLPGTGNTQFNNGACPATLSGGSCLQTATQNGNQTNTVYTLQPTVQPDGTIPPVMMENVTVNGTTELRLHGGTYVVNTLSLTGGAKLVVEPNTGPVIIRVAGKSLSGNAAAIDLSGGGLSNPTYDPTNLQLIYGGDKVVKITGGTDSAAVVYAPNATGSLSGASTHFYGSVILNKVTSFGGFNLYYDRRLSRTTMTAGQFTMSSFNWETF